MERRPLAAFAAIMIMFVVFLPVAALAGAGVDDTADKNVRVGPSEETAPGSSQPGCGPRVLEKSIGKDGSPYAGGQQCALDLER